MNRQAASQLEFDLHDVEVIIWRDAFGTSERIQEAEIPGITVATNVNIGYIIHENDDRLILANGHSTSGEIDHIVIPAENVTARYPVRLRELGGTTA